jgi:protein-S-isoprenylcysteine O-methyltransferase Ste14
MENASKTNETVAPIPVKSYIFFAFYVLVFPGIIFVAAGTLRWPMGWWYYGISVAATVISRLIVARVNPDQLRERGRSMEAENTKSWDRLLSMLVGLLLPVISLIVIGLDYRFAWSPAFPSWMPIVGLVALVLGYALATWAFIVNRFFSGVVRIQEDRGHTVVTDGPYRFVRHPGYLGGLISLLGTPVLLGSLWGYLPALVYVIVLGIRTELEDRTLKEELTGYQAYAQQTQYRLLPGLW